LRVRAGQQEQVGLGLHRYPEHGLKPIWLKPGSPHPPAVRLRAVLRFWAKKTAAGWAV
jgi:hypothetical protein